MSDPRKYFLTEAIRHAREMSFQDGLTFLEGLVMSCGDHPHVEQLRAIVISLRKSDKQLDLFDPNDPEHL